MSDPYVDERRVLRNRLGTTEAARLAVVEHRWAAFRELELYVSRPVAGGYDLAHLRGIHRHLFGDVYAWAGVLRTIELAKGGTHFVPAGQLHGWARVMFARLADRRFLAGLDRPAFVIRAAEVLADLLRVDASVAAGGQVGGGVAGPQ